MTPPTKCPKCWNQNENRNLQQWELNLGHCACPSLLCHQAMPTTLRKNVHLCEICTKMILKVAFKSEMTIFHFYNYSKMNIFSLLCLHVCGMQGVYVMHVYMCVIEMYMVCEREMCIMCMCVVYCVCVCVWTQVYMLYHLETGSFLCYLPLRLRLAVQ